MMDDFPPENWRFMITQTLCFVAIWLSLQKYVSSHGPLSGARTVIKFNSFFYATVSFFMFVLILSPAHENLSRQLYHASKFYEYIDILSVISSGGEIGLHFGFHHLTTPYFTFIRVTRNTEGWQVFSALNTFHHALMYAYFGGIGFLRPILLFTGHVQLIVGIAVECRVGYSALLADKGLVWPHVVAGSLLGAYLVLSTLELIQPEGKKAKKHTKST